MSLILGEISRSYYSPTYNKSLIGDGGIVFSSHQLHEITMYYPMRGLRTQQYRLLHNINYKTPYPIAEDIAMCPTFQVIQCGG